MKVLLIEDEAIVATSFQLVLQSQPEMDVEVAPDARKALIMIEEQGLPDVILLDLGLPKMSGAEFIEELEGRPDAAGAKVIVVTSDPAGAPLSPLVKEVLQKPIEPNTVIEAVRAMGKGGVAT